MALINEMSVDINGGVSLKKHYSYYTYDKTLDIVSNNNINLLTGEYIIVSKNTNINFYLDVYDSTLCLLLDESTPISNWIDTYINSIVTTGYTGGYDDSDIEDRIIYDKLSGNYYKVDYITNSPDHLPDSQSIWGIVDNINEEIWNGIDNYFYSDLDSCGLETGKQLIALMDINEMSPTRYNIKYIEKTPTVSETPTVITEQNVTSITNNTAIVSGAVILSGSTPVTESGFCYSIYTNPDINDIKVPVSSGVVWFSETLINLISLTTYYIRTYAINSNGISYGNEIYFKTT